MHKLATSIRGGDNGGHLYIFVPAAELDTTTFRRLAVSLTTSPPQYSSGRTSAASSGCRR
jgi:hypothetical protein